MPQVSTITLNDGQVTPVAHIFSPTRMSSGAGFVFEDRSAGIKAGYNTIRVESRVNRDGTTKIDIVLTVPRLAVTAPASGSGVQPNPTRAYAELARLTVTRPDALEQSVANDGYAFLKNLMADTQFIAWIKDGDLAF